MHHIRASLPDIKSRISANQQKFTAELLTLGGPLGDGNSGNIVLSVITEFTSEFRTTIDGNTNDLSLNELSGGARISFVFHELFNNGVKSIDPFDQVKDGDIRTMLYNSSVRQQTSRIPFPIFTILYHRVQHQLFSSGQQPSRSL
jgi:dynamin 1-like protein